MLSYFILSERSYFGVFDVCYAELSRLIQFSHVFCWTNKRNGTMTIYYKCSDSTTVLIHFEANFIIAEYAGMVVIFVIERNVFFYFFFLLSFFLLYFSPSVSPSVVCFSRAGLSADEHYFCHVVHVLREILTHIYYNCSFEELINCHMCNEGHTYYLSDLHDTKVWARAMICSAMIVVLKYWSGLVLFLLVCFGCLIGLFVDWLFVCLVICLFWLFGCLVLIFFLWFVSGSSENC
jgi:hypothetical protein